MLFIYFFNNVRDNLEGTNHDSPKGKYRNYAETLGVAQGAMTAELCLYSYR